MSEPGNRVIDGATADVRANRGVDAALHPDRWYVRALRLLVAVWAAAGVVQNTVDSATGRNDTDLLQHFSLFTIQSNIVLVVVLVIGALVSRSRLPSWWDAARGAAAFYLVMTGLVYAILVAPPGELLRWDIGWTGLVLHRVAPAFAMLDWLLVTMSGRSTWWRPLAWLGYPIAFLLYTWARGGVTGWYPYDFLDPLGPGGWAAVLATTAQVLVAFLAVAVVLHLGGVLRASLARGRASTRPLGAAPRARGYGSRSSRNPATARNCSFDTS